MMEKPWHKHWPCGQPWLLDYPEAPVDIILRSAARKFPDRAGIIFSGAVYTYAELWEGAQRFAAALASLGVGKSDVVALHLPNCPQFVMAYYGIFLAGATFSPVSPLLSPRELEFQLNDCRAKVVVTFDLFARPLLAIRERTGVKCVIVTGGQEARQKAPADYEALGDDLISFQNLLERHQPVPPGVALEPKKDIAHLAYTGGTTGRSKGVMLTHYNVVANTIQYTCWSTSGRPVVREEVIYIEDKYQDPPGTLREFTSGEGEDVTINVTPWFHAMGTIGYLNRFVIRGFTVILHPRLEPEKYLEDAEKYRVTYIGGAPPLFLAILNAPGFGRRDLRSVKYLASGAAPLAVELLEKLKKAFPDAVVVEAYGLTEATMGVTANPSNRSGLRKAGTVGIPVYDTEVKIVDLETGEKELPPGETGEICVRGPQVMLGYLNQPEETAGVLRGGWLYTGDIGFMDDDGYITIVDRKKDMLIYKGYNVYPRELEEILFRHPGVANCTVIGVEDPAVGEFPKAFVVKKPGYAVSEQELLDYVNKEVVFYKKLREVEFVEEIPVSQAGKVLKRVLREEERKKRATRD